MECVSSSVLGASWEPTQLQASAYLVILPAPAALSTR